MANRSEQVLITTTDGVEGRQVVRYLGLVYGEYVHSPGWLRNLADDVRHALDDRTREFDSEMLQGRLHAMREVRQHASELRADAVIGAALEVEVLRGGMVVTLAHGTAVQLDQPTTGGWVQTVVGSRLHPIVAGLDEHGPATLAELAERLDSDIDWLDATLSSLLESGQVAIDDDGRWHPVVQDAGPPGGLPR